MRLKFFSEACSEAEGHLTPPGHSVGLGSFEQYLGCARKSWSLLADYIEVVLSYNYLKIV